MGIFSSLNRIFADKDTCPECKGSGHSTVPLSYKTDRYFDPTNNVPLHIEHQLPTTCHKCGGSGKKRKSEAPIDGLT